MSVPSLQDRINAMNLSHVGRSPQHAQTSPVAELNGSAPAPSRRPSKPPPLPPNPPRRRSTQDTNSVHSLEDEAEEGSAQRSRPPLPPRTNSKPKPPLPPRQGSLPPPPPYSAAVATSESVGPSPVPRPTYSSTPSTKKYTHSYKPPPKPTTKDGPRNLPPINHVAPAITSSWKQPSEATASNGRPTAAARNETPKRPPPLPGRKSSTLDMNAGNVPPTNGLQSKRSVPDLPRRSSAIERPPLPVPTLPTPSTQNRPDPRQMGFGISKNLPPPVMPTVPKRPESVPVPEVPMSTRPKINLSNKPKSSMQTQPPIPAMRPEPQVGSFQAPTNPACLKCRDFSQVDAHAARFPRHAYDDVRRLTIDLTSPFDSATDKARAIFTWLHHNVAYDVDSFFNNCVQPSTPEGVLRSGLAVCDGYAGLFSAMALYAGLEAVKIGGHGKGYGHSQGTTVPPFEGNHAWNACRIDDGEWHCIDACWGAGNVQPGKYNKAFDPQHFIMSNEEFREKHFPDEPRYQFCPTVIGWDEYYLHEKNAPETYCLLGKEDMAFGKDSIEPRSKVLKAYTRYRFRIAGVCAHKPATKHWVLLVKSDKNEVVMKDDGRGGFVADAVTGPAGQDTKLAVVIQWNGRSGKGLSPSAYENKRGANSWSTQGLGGWTVV